MNSRQRWKAIKRRGPIVWQNVEMEYGAHTVWNQCDGEPRQYFPAFYYFDPYYCLSAFIPAGTKKDQYFIQYELDKDDMSVVCYGWQYPKEPLNLRWVEVHDE